MPQNCSKKDVRTKIVAQLFYNLFFSSILCLFTVFFMYIYVYFNDLVYKAKL